MSQPTLVFVAELPWTVNTGHPEDNRGQAVDAVVVSHVLVGRSLRTSVWRIEVERAGFRYSIGKILEDVPRLSLSNAHVFDFAIHLVGGRVEHGRQRLELPGSLENVKSSQRVGREIIPRVG